MITCNAIHLQSVIRLHKMRLMTQKKIGSKFKLKQFHPFKKKIIYCENVHECYFILHVLHIFEVIDFIKFKDRYLTLKVASKVLIYTKANSSFKKLKDYLG